MSHAQDGQRMFFPVGNPFRMILTRGAHLSPKLTELLTSYEEGLASSLRKLKPEDTSKVLTLSWMKVAVDSLSELHTNIATLITELELPGSDWDEKWVDIYLNSSVKLMDICIALSSELARLDQGQLLVRYVLHVLDSGSTMPSHEQLIRAEASLKEWMERARRDLLSLRIAWQCYRSLLESFSDEEEVVTSDASAQEGVTEDQFKLADVATQECRLIVGESITEEVMEEVEMKQVAKTIGLAKEVMMLEVTSDRQHQNDNTKQADGAETNGLEMREELLNCISSMSKSAEGLRLSLDSASKRVGDFFQIVLTGRDALLCNLRISDESKVPAKVR
ncbi:hypothetical protein PR202_ga07572 [Eleusine coracana subsp. coracana]|uniref:Uncharacterized protein n=1 Tax=Eleusine coracana subsp. coracana TaxID=191504 RepID=A0AAV5BXU0_ELECO|nr:hypothetical protein PR202_ga07572 [Eleusine coracana subsp. coracana]